MFQTSPTYFILIFIKMSLAGTMKIRMLPTMAAANYTGSQLFRASQTSTRPVVNLELLTSCKLYMVEWVQ
ncbi:MAG: hypothetical protein ACU0C9_11980 [Paracoccaceae bacterium]